MADNNSTNNSQQDIIDNLLVKEETGNLHYLQEKKSDNNKQNSSNISNNNTVVKEDDLSQNKKENNIDYDLEKITVAPEDDNFVHELPEQKKLEEKSELTFHPEDQMQIVRLSESVPVDDSKKYSIEKIIAKILTKQEIVLDDVNKKLFSSLILDFFRNRKSAIAVRELLATKIISNEKTLSADIVDNILSIIKSLKAKIDAEGGLVVSPEEIKKQTTKPNIQPIASEGQVIENQPSKENKPPVVSEDEIETKEEQSDLKKETPDTDDEKKSIAEDTYSKKDLEDIKNNESTQKEKLDESDSLVKPVKFGEEPKGIEELENEPKSSAEIKPDEIEDSLKEIQNIMPDMATDKKQDDNEEDDLLKELALDSDKINSDNKPDVSLQEDLHDVGQLMTEDLEEKKENAEDDEDGFVLKKIKPAVVSVADSSENDSNNDNVEGAENVVEKKDLNDDVSAENIDSKNSNLLDDKQKVLVEDNLEKNEYNSNIESNQNTNLSSTDSKNTSLDENTETNQNTSNNIVSPETAQSEKKEKNPLPKVVRPEQTFSVKPKISDVQEASPSQSTVKQKYVLTGPVQELNDMTLRSFRFLGTNAQDRTNKILEKISILEQDSYTKKVEGVKAWRNSPVNKMYLNLGAEGMSTGKNIETLINEKKIAGEEIIDMAEFDAISDLNKSLRF